MKPKEGAFEVIFSRTRTCNLSGYVKILIGTVLAQVVYRKFTQPPNLESYINLVVIEGSG